MNNDLLDTTYPNAEALGDHINEDVYRSMQKRGIPDGTPLRVRVTYEQAESEGGK